MVAGIEPFDGCGRPWAMQSCRESEDREARHVHDVAKSHRRPARTVHLGCRGRSHVSRSRRAFAAASSGFLVVLVLYVGLSYAVYLLAKSPIFSGRYSSESLRTYFDATGALPFGLFEGGARPATAQEWLLATLGFVILYCFAGALVAVAVRSRFLAGAAPRSSVCCC